MSKNNIARTKKQLSPNPAAKQPDYPVEPEDLEEQQARLRKAAAAGAVALKPPSPAATPEQSVPVKPLAPLAALWPDPVPPTGGSRPSQGPTPQKAPVAAAPTPAPALAPPAPKSPAQSARPISQKKSGFTPPATTPAAAKAFKVSFALLDPHAKQVALSGEFNGWSSNATPMKRDAGGNWVTTVALAPGRYEYKFIVDGQWIHDPQARENVSNNQGTLNSVVQVWA